MTHYIYSVMPPEEEYRINGTVCNKTIEFLLDKPDPPNEDDISDIVDHIDNVKNSYILPEDDIDAMHEFINTISDDNIQKTLSDMLLLIEKQISINIDKNNDELDKALKIVNSIVTL